MKKTLILHIGMPKTGTTTIQNTLVENTEALSARRILYPEFGRRFGAHHLLVDPLVIHKNPYVPPAEMSADEVVAKIFSWSDDAAHDTFIVSSEAFSSGRGFRPAIREVARTFQIHTVLVLREQAAYANSLLNQKLKMALFRPDREGGFQESLLKSVEVPNYIEIARMWREGTADAPLTVIPFIAGVDIWAEFAKAVGGLEGLTVDRERRNASLRPEALAFILWFNRTKRETSPPERARIASILEDYSLWKAEEDPGSITLLDPGVQRLVRDLAKPVNVALAEEFFDGVEVFGDMLEARFVDISAIGGQEGVLEVVDYVLSRYDRHVTFLKSRGQ
ncbi:MAG: hypothetical protein AAF368_08095 [Planctomycetota bacterium]